MIETIRNNRPHWEKIHFSASYICPDILSDIPLPGYERDSESLSRIAGSELGHTGNPQTTCDISEAIVSYPRKSPDIFRSWYTLLFLQV